MISYEELTEELLSQRIVDYADIFNYNEAPLKALFHDFYVFCQTNLSEHCEQYNIQPARFHYKNDYGINARAGYFKGYYLIQVNAMTIVETFKRFFANNSLFKENQEIVSLYGEIESFIKIPLGVIMYQAALQFTYYHELAHLIQKPFQQFSSLDELNHNIEKADHLPLKHYLEFDADLHAANLVPAHILDFWKKMPQKNRTNENLSKLLSVGVAGILNYFMFMEAGYNGIYFRESTHPHPLIRATYITDVMINIAAINVDFELDSSGILREAFNITEWFCDHNGFENFAIKFKIMFRDNFDDIKRYIDQLAVESENIPNLVKNKFPNGI